MKASRFFSVLFLSVLAVGCEEKIETPNGEIPAEMISEARRYEGTYYGQVERHSNRATLSLEGNRPVLSFVQDMIAPQCQSAVGQLLRVNVSKKDGVAKLNSAVFAFDPNRCALSVEGRELHLYFQDESRFDTSLLQTVEYERICDGFPTPPVGGGNNCRWESRPIYFSGQFSR